jgi:hypothetical protein
MSSKINQTKQQLNPSAEEPADVIPEPEIDSRIAELAYYKAESRGFEPGYDMQDWLEAEQEVLLQ